MTHSLFVYGTRKRGAAGEGRRLLRGAEFVSRASTTGTLYDLGRYPGLVRRAATTERVTGELFQLPDDKGDRILRELDIYEGSEFTRRRVYVVLPNGKKRIAWAYILRRSPPATARLIHSGRYAARRHVA
jgi:gamma-glutamylcyclotransferase (GGCT)/AIG2-like uncharacterized protein YtfP